MEVKLFKFSVEDFEEVYAITDNENKRLHISSVFYNYNITLDLTKDLNTQVKKWIQWEELNFRNKVRKVIDRIIFDLGFYK